MATVERNLLEEIQLAQPDPGPDRPGIVAAELPPLGEYATARVQITESGGYVRVFHLGDKDVRVIPRSVLVSVLEKKLPDGSPAFTTRIPNPLPPRAPTYLCPLHPDAPHSKEVIDAGFNACPVDTFRTEMDAQLHLQHKHKNEYRWMERRRVVREQEDAQKTQRMLAQAIESLAKRRGKDD